MTNQEAIKRIKEHIAIHKYRELHAIHIVEALEMAISALQAQDVPDTNVGDTISRQAAIDVCNNANDLWHGQLGEGIVIAVKKKVEELPSAQPESEERKAESAQNVPKEDLISRKAVIDAIVDCTVYGNADDLKEAVMQKKAWDKWSGGVLKALEAVEDLPSAQPEQAVKDCRNCKHGNYNDHWKTHFCYNPNECTEWNLWEPITQPERLTELWICGKENR